MKYEQTVQIETVEYICLVKRIDGDVAQKTLETELIRCKDCKYYDGRWCKRDTNDLFHTLVRESDFCSFAEKAE